MSLNQRENAMLHLTHICNVIDTVKTFPRKLKALLRMTLTIDHEESGENLGDSTMKYGVGKNC